MTKEAAKNQNPEVTSLLMVSLLFIVHTMTNAVLLSPIGQDVRCLFWDQQECSDDEGWMANWFSFSHFHVGSLLAGMAYAASGTDKLEAVVSYTVAAIIFIYMTEGIMMMEVLNTDLMVTQLGVFMFFLACICYYTLDQERRQPFFPLPRRLTTSSFDGRGKISVTAIAVLTQFASSLYRTLDMTLGGGHEGYKGDQSSLVYQSISKMALCDMMIVPGLLAVSLRFFEPDQQKSLLWCQTLALVVSLAMLAGDQGEMLEKEQQQAGSIGTFISLLVSILGAL